MPGRLPDPEVWLAPSTLKELIVKSSTGGGWGLGLGFGFFVGGFLLGLAVKVTSGPASCVGSPAVGVPEGEAAWETEPVGDAGVLRVGRWSPVTRSSSLWTTYPMPTATRVTKTAAVAVASTPGVTFTDERYLSGPGGQDRMPEL